MRKQLLIGGGNTTRRDNLVATDRLCPPPSELIMLPRRHRQRLVCQCRIILPLVGNDRSSIRIEPHGNRAWRTLPMRIEGNVSRLVNPRRRLDLRTFIRIGPPSIENKSFKRRLVRRKRVCSIRNLFAGVRIRPVEERSAIRIERRVKPVRLPECDIVSIP